MAHCHIAEHNQSGMMFRSPSLAQPRGRPRPLKRRTHDEANNARVTNRADPGETPRGDDEGDRPGRLRHRARGSVETRRDHTTHNRR